MAYSGCAGQRDQLAQRGQAALQFPAELAVFAKEKIFMRLNPTLPPPSLERAEIYAHC